MYTSLSFSPTRTAKSIVCEGSRVRTKSAQASKMSINELELISREKLQLTRGFDLKRHHGIKRHGWIRVGETLGGIIFYEFNRNELERTGCVLCPTGVLEAVQSFFNA